MSYLVDINAGMVKPTVELPACVLYKFKKFNFSKK